MPMRPDQVQPPTLDPEALYAFCLDKVRAQQRMQPALSSLQTKELLWPMTVSLAHALETAERGLGIRVLPDPQQRVKWIASIIRTPTSAGLYHLWRAWAIQHFDWVLANTLQVPVYFLLCQRNFFGTLRELGRRGRHLPVLKGWGGLEAGPCQPDAVRQQRFLDAMDATLKVTVGRRLDNIRSQNYEDDPSPLADLKNVALWGAVEREHRGKTWIAELLRQEGSITTHLGELVEVPTIPALPVLGMEHIAGQDAVWRALAKDSAYKVLAAIAPGILGKLETALPDAAHAAQRAERDRVSAKERGGSGGRKAERAGTTEPAAVHVPIGDPDENSDCIDPETLVDDSPNPQQMAEAYEEELEAKENARRAFEMAADRWGPSGRRMLEALASGETAQAAAKAAGISAPALIKRRKTLKKMLRS